MNVAGSVGISPSSVHAPVSGIVNFDGIGGVPPYTFTLLENNSGGSIDPDTGLYTAGSIIGAIDTVLVADDTTPTPGTAQTTVTVTEVYLPIDQTIWTLLYVDSEEVVGTYKPATNAFDGDPTTIWHTKWYQADPEYPHEIQIDLGDVYNIDGFWYLPNQDQPTGRISLYEFYVSIDGEDWGNPVAAGYFSRGFEEQEVIFPRVIGQYIRLVALSEINRGPHTTIAEINVLGALFSGQLPPDSIIDTPDKNQTIFVGNSVPFTGTGVDMGGPLPLSYEWNFDDPGIPDAYVEDPGSIIFNTPGIYTVTFIVSDGDGNADSTPATRIIKVLEPSSNVIIPQLDWTLKSVDSEELNSVYKPAVHSFDGDPSTLWHTEWPVNNPDAVHPHEISINLGYAYLIDTFLYLPRQDGNSSGRIAGYYFFVSADGKNWGTPVASGILVNTSTEKRILFNPKWGQFVRLVATSEVNGNVNTSMAELNLEGESNVPYVRIIDPQTGVIQQGPDLTVTASVCLNSINHSGWGVKFIADSNEVEAQVVPEGSDTFTATFSGLGFGEHIVEVVIVDNDGVEQTGETAYDVAYNVALGDYYVAVGDSITAGIMDDYPDDNVSQDGRNVGEGFSPVLNDLLTAAKSYPHTVVREGLAGEKTRGGLARLPSVLDRHPNAGYVLISWGANDRISSGLFPLPSGLSLSPGDPGYAGSYKDLTQQMIDLATDAGKEVYLSEILFSQIGGSVNVDHQEYNAVVYELCIENYIPVTPPPFYTHFEQHPDELIDGTHPTGMGYRSMADLWFNAITNPIP